MLIHPTRLKKFDPNAVIQDIMEIAKVKTFKEPPIMTYEAHGDETFQGQIPNLKGDSLRFHQVMTVVLDTLCTEAQEVKKAHIKACFRQNKLIVTVEVC